jgi:hypothetical protein
MKFAPIQKGLAIIASCLATVTIAQANSLTPGNFIGLSLEVEPVGATLLATTNVSFSGIDAGNNVLFSGTLTSSVWSGDTSNPYGGLTFTYQLTSALSSLHTIDRFTLNSFSGLLTDVGYNGAGIVPIRAVRPGSDLIAFVFENALFQPTLGPGLSSATLVIQTDSLYWAIGSGSVIDGATASVSAFAPIAVPEPTSMALVGLGVAALLFRRKS